MLLTPTEIERLTIFNAAELARRHRARGIKLSQPEAVALICDEILMGAREGRGVADLASLGSTLLTTDDVLPGVGAMTPKIQIEGMFPDGAKMVTVHQPIRPGKAPPEEADYTPGELIPADGEIELNPSRRRRTVRVRNTGATPATARVRGVITSVGYVTATFKAVETREHPNWPQEQPVLQRGTPVYQALPDSFQPDPARTMTEEQADGLSKLAARYRAITRPQRPRAAKRRQPRRNGSTPD